MKQKAPLGNERPFSVIRNERNQSSIECFIEDGSEILHNPHVILVAQILTTKEQELMVVKE